MYRIICSNKDGYITNRIIDNSYRAVDANVGYAATLDLFKLFDESSIVGEDQPSELSRLLIKVDLDPIRALTGSILNIDDPSFKVSLRMHDVVGGQPTPDNFTVVVHPLSKSWDEGIGRDVGRFSDLDAANWLTASVSNGLDVWNSPGASAEGLLGSNDIDIISSGNLNDGLGVRDLFKTQTFSTGEEDLDVDITDLVSATLAGNLPDYGYRVAFSPVFEEGSSSLFVKRFAARHASNPRIRPGVVVRYDESFRDNHQNFVFDTSGSLFLFNEVRGQPTNLISGTTGTQLTGDGVLTLKLISGTIAPAVSQSFASEYTVNQFSYGTNYVTGVYVANLAVSSFDPSLQDEVYAHGSATFYTVWGSTDGTVPYKTGTLVVRRSDLQTYTQDNRQLNVTIPNHRQVYRRASKARVRVNAYDVSTEYAYTRSKLPVERVGLIFERMYWRLIDVYSGETIVPFDTVYNSTRLSTDSKGMFFDFYPEDYSIGRVLGFEFMIIDGTEEIIIDKNLPTFRIEP